jgi:hypothetical protein
LVRWPINSTGMAAHDNEFDLFKVGAELSQATVRYYKLDASQIRNTRN